MPIRDNYDYTDPDYTYTDPKTKVLRNLLNISDPKGLVFFESAAVLKTRQMTLMYTTVI